MQAVLAEILAMRDDAERRLARARSDAARDELRDTLVRLDTLRQQIEHEGAHMTAETARSLLREIRGR